MNSQAQIRRDKLEKRLLQSRRNLLWSYKKNKSLRLSDQVIINKVLLFGNHDDWKDLKIAFSVDTIKDVWKSDLLLGQYYFEKQKELVKFFFGSRDPQQYIYKNRRRALNKTFERSF